MDFIQTDSQKFYNQEIEALNLFQFQCPCCQCIGQFVKHAYYSRSFKFQNDEFTGKVKLKVLRVRCQKCESTHAVLPSWIVPYSQHLLHDQIEIISAYESGLSLGEIEPENPEIDASNVAHIIKQYLLHWKQRLLSICLSFPGDVNSFISACFEGYRRQFMQIKKTINCLQVSST